MPLPIDAEREYRNALGAFATGVTVITTRAPDGTLHGLTVNSFSAVSLEPRLILWSQSTRATSVDAFGSVGCFAVNVLGLEQLDLARRFGRPSADKFAGLAIRDGLGAAPLITGAVATFECSSVARYPGGDHVIHVGRVERFAHTTGAPLLFARGRYQRGHDLESRPDPDADLAAAWDGLA